MLKPTRSFILPSVHDGTELHARLYHPPGPQSSPNRTRGAVVAHPWASLGGCYDDMTVLETASTLINQGYIVCTFNFRGARPSQGSTSWSGKPEVGDYMTFVGFLSFYMLQPEMTIVLAGYSYGTVILSNLPPLRTMIRRFEECEKTSAEAEIVELARRYSKEYDEQARLAGSNHVPFSRVELGSEPVFKLGYLFISPVLGITKRFLHWTQAREEEFWDHPVLVVHGSSDVFTGVKAVEQWAKGSKTEVEIFDDGHFWTNSHSQQALKDTIGVWAGSL